MSLTILEVEARLKEAGISYRTVYSHTLAHICLERFYYLDRKYLILLRFKDGAYVSCIVTYEGRLMPQDKLFNYLLATDKRYLYIVDLLC